MEHLVIRLDWKTKRAVRCQMILECGTAAFGQWLTCHSPSSVTNATQAIHAAIHSVENLKQVLKRPESQLWG